MSLQEPCFESGGFFTNVAAPFAGWPRRPSEAAPTAIILEIDAPNKRLRIPIRLRLALLNLSQAMYLDLTLPFRHMHHERVNSYGH